VTAAPPGTLERALAAAEHILARGGVAEPRREALTLWAALTGTSPGAAWMERDAPVPPPHERAFTRAVARRAAGVPFAYAAGTAAFRRLELAVDPHVLIPRPETEGLVEHVLRWCRARNRWGVAADIGTGSGCIALSLAVEGHFARVLATDVSAEALTVAARNAEHVAPRTPVEFRAGDLLAPIHRDEVDVLVSNPPYVATDEWMRLDPGVRDHEPRLALDGGPDGMRLIRDLLWQATGRVREGGLLALEVDCGRAADARAAARAAGWTSATIEPDLYGRERYLLAMREF
jgi:release factor glutamine methyltransferase